MCKRLFELLLVLSVIFVCNISAYGATEQQVLNCDSGNTAWMMVSSALVLLMLPGLALFYAGMVRSKNVLATMMHSFLAMAIISIQWVVIGYTLAFGPDIRGIIGGLDFFLLNGINPCTLHGDIPLYVFIMFQGMFAIITPALISGALAERVKFSAFLLFIVLWSTVIYDPIAHWVWGEGGWLYNMGALDFAGGTVVHISSGISSLAAIIILGKRKGYLKETLIPHNMTITLLGAGLLWIGWFGFNAGSALAANTSAGLAFITTHLASSSAALSWLLYEWKHQGRPSALGFASGIVAGLVAITPAAGFVKPGPAIIIGLVAGILCYRAVLLKVKIGYDDSLDVFGIHGVGGIWGALATGIFVTIGGSGVLAGNYSQLVVQFVGILATVFYAFVGTYIIILVLDKIVGLRVSEEDEVIGLDQTQHGEIGYRY
ncbi:MAG: ammonium transporter [Thermodesulfobacteriota bacterium]|nr:ammonium transporter [Thermodesulfobacteriota bacterium]